MNKNKLSSRPVAEQAIHQVLQAERDAEQAIRDCEDEARVIIKDAHGRAQRINARTDQRITNMEMRHDHKLDKAIKAIEREGMVELRLDAGQQTDAETLRAAIDAMAIELCQARSTVDD